MRGTAALVFGAVGTVVGVILVLLLIVLPSSEDDCDQTPPPAPPVGDCAPAGSAADAGLQPDARRVSDCVSAHFGVKTFTGPGEQAMADHASGRAVDFVLDGAAGTPVWNTDAGRALGDEIVQYLQQNARAFGIDYVIWRERTWFPDPTGAAAGVWQPRPPAGDPTRDYLDHIHVAVRDSGVSPAAAVVPGIDGANPAGVQNESGQLAPSSVRRNPMGGPYRITDGFGARDGTHMGVDFAAAAGTPIVAAADGRVVAAGPAEGFGNWIVIDSVDPSGVGFSTVYGHMESGQLYVQVGQTVAAGTHIADVGSAGESSGPHLHFEVVPGGRLTGGTPIDPLSWLAGAPMTGPSAAAPGDIDCYNGFGTAGGNLAPGKVPPNLAAWYRRAGSLCPEIGASLLAAQGNQESGFNSRVVSPAGAVGIAQFLPSTAAAIDPDDGQPYVIDADGAGTASVWDPADAIIGQGRYMCRLAHQIDQWEQQGKVSGNTTALALAAYNAGLGAVLESGGMPDLVPAHFSETQPYVRNILQAEPLYRAPGGVGEFEPGTGTRSDLGTNVLTAAQQWLGTPYALGGVGPGTATGDGFDMAGLTAAAVATASGGRITLPDTAEEQWRLGAEVPLGDAHPGDLVFGDFGLSGPGSVGVYAGSGSVITAQPGVGVTHTPLLAGMRARRYS
jgi:murein DD-endopeptidase MepM/ murein hydrolase activator NlpD/cell wall-associated NlpC family hydrolase